MATAILIDGAFFLRRFSKCFPSIDTLTPQKVALALRYLVHWHITIKIGHKKMNENVQNKINIEESRELYRVFFYDCPPLTKRMHRPISGNSINLAKTKDAIFRLKAHKEIEKLRKVALRLGRLNNTSNWRLTESATRKLIANPDNFSPSDESFEIDTKQKGVDMRLGLDIASLAFKKQVDQIIIVAGDADFVPAVKLARREGIDVILDRMGDQRAASDLIKHVDGIRDCYLSQNIEL